MSTDVGTHGDDNVNGKRDGKHGDGRDDKRDDASGASSENSGASGLTMAPRAKRRLGRTLLKIGAGAVALVVVLLAAAPTLLSGYAKGAIEEAVGAAVQGSVKVDSVSLGWFSGQQVDGLTIDGGAEVGRVALTARVEQGLWALATGSDIAVAARGSVDTRVESDGRVSLAGLLRAADVSANRSGVSGDDAAAARSVQSAPSSTASSTMSVLGTRKATIEIEGIDLHATSHDGAEYALEKLTGSLKFVGSEREIGVDVALNAVAKSRQQSGALALKATAALALGAGGALDGAKSSGSVDIDATNLALPSGAGEIVVQRLAIAAEKAVSGECSVEVRADARVAQAAPSTVRVQIETQSLFGTDGAFTIDPALIAADVDVRALPLGVFQPFAPELSPGQPLNFVRDVGESADLKVVKQTGKLAQIALETPRVKITFEGAIAPDGSSIENGTLDATAALGQELLSALDTGFAFDAPTPIAVKLTGERVEWKSAADATATGSSTPLGGVFRLALESPCVMRGIAEKLDARAEKLAVTVEKTRGEATARVIAQATASYNLAAGVNAPKRAGSSAAVSVSASAVLELASGDIPQAALDATIGLDPAVVEQYSASSVRVRGQEATVKLSAAELSYEPSRGQSGIRAARGRARVELGGALELALDAVGSGAPTSAAVNDLALAFVLPSNATPGSFTLAAKIDGAQTRIEQQFAAIPDVLVGSAPVPTSGAAQAASSFDVAALGLSGTVDIQGLDPAMVGRFVPSQAKAAGLLGRGAMSFVAKNRTTVENARPTMHTEFTLHASTIESRASVSISKDAIAARGLEIDATLPADALGSLGLGDGIVIDAGAKFSLRAPMLGFTRTQGADQAQGAWNPSSNLAATVSVDSLRIARAPGLHAPVGVERITLSATYDLSTQAATGKGMAFLGRDGDGGKLDFDLTWKKPSQPKLFGGTEGNLALSGFNLARYEAALGLAAGSYSGMLGGGGFLTVAFNEADAAHAHVQAEFPKSRADFTLDVLATNGARRVDAHGNVTAEISADAFGALAGLNVAQGAAAGQSTTRRVTLPVDSTLSIEKLSVPLNADMVPSLADASLALTGTLSSVAIEVKDATGAKSTVSTGALSLAVTSERLKEAITVKVATASPTANAPAAAGAATGSLTIDAVIRGAVVASSSATADGNANANARPNPGASARAAVATPAGANANGSSPATARAANPVIDATVKAVKFPAATFDAFAATNGAIAKYVGDSIDAEVIATNLSADRGTLRAKISSPFATLDAPALTLADGFVRLGDSKPLLATFSMSPTVREELLASINPVFADVVAGQPAKFTLTNLSWPLDGNRRTFDGAFTLETGEVKLTNSGPLAFLISAVGGARSDGFEAYLEPLRGSIAKGRLTYRDFALRMGKSTGAANAATGSASGAAWKNSLVFAGDIDLASKPMRAHSISTGMPLSDAANWSRDAKALFDSIGAASPELLKKLVVGVDMSGPLFDAAGKPAKLEAKLKLPDVGDLIRDDPGALIDAAGSIFDAIRGPKKPKNKAKDTKPKDATTKDATPKDSEAPAENSVSIS